MPQINLKTAAIILERAFTDAEVMNDPISELITEVLNGSHKTYRYILVTGLLGKATNEEVNPLSLQLGDGQNGQYNARDLCHKVIVPFETIRLQGCMGNSNEPFLNKPARFVTLSTGNAVRRGADFQTLSKVIQILSSLKDSEDAFRYLKHALSVLIDIHKNYISKYALGDALIDVSEFAQIVLDYIYKITDHSFEGEICPLVVAQLEKLYLGKGYRVEPHKVNQSGASSKETGDIDVYNHDGALVYSIEVKDKDFTEHDVVHAVDKFRAANLTTSMFIYGKYASFDEESVFAALKRIGREGHFCCLIGILSYAKLRIADLKTVTLREFVDGLLVFAKALNATNSTVGDIKAVASQIFR